MKIVFLFLVLFYLVTESIFFWLYKRRSNWEKFKRTRRVVRILFFIIFFISLSLMIFNSFNRQEEKPRAEIFQKENEFHLILKKRFDYMTHDPLSVFKQETYLDSIDFIIPRSKGIIKGEEIVKKTGYPMIGYIKIEKSEVEVQLIYNNYDDKTYQNTHWNDKYSLK